MDDHQPSPTALRVAALRALHQTDDVPPIFVDPIATQILGPNAGDFIAYYRERADETARLRGTLAARAVIAEEAIAEAAARGVRQCVILGAGLDTFAYRHAEPELHVFEVDHPATQAWKQDLLASSAIAVPPRVTYVPLHFERDDLFAALAAEGFDAATPAVFTMLGVVPYVESATVLETFGRIASRCAHGTEIVFDYTEPFQNAPAEVRNNYQAVADRVAKGGEPWITFFEPEPLDRMLRNCGFDQVTDIPASILQERFCVGRTDHLTIAPLVHLVRART